MACRVAQLCVFCFAANAALSPTFCRWALAQVASAEIVPAEKTADEKQAAKLAERDRLVGEVQKLYAADQFARALELSEQTLDLEIELYGPRHENVAEMLGWIAGMQLTVGKFDDAKASLDRQIETLEELPGVAAWKVADARRLLADVELRSHLSAEMQEKLRRAEAMHERSGLEFGRGEYRQALKSLREVVASYQEILGPEHAKSAAALNHLGFMLSMSGDYAAARPLFEQALAINRKSRGEDHPEVGTTLHNIGDLLLRTGDFPAARVAYEQALAVRRKALGEEHGDVASTLNSLGNLAGAAGDYPAARTYYEKALAVNRKVYGEEHAYTATTLSNLGRVLQQAGDMAAARERLEEALAIRRRVLGKQHPDVAASLNSVGLLYSDLGDFSRARACFLEALEIQRQVLGNEHPATARTLNNLAGVLRDLGDYKTAESNYKQCLAALRKSFGENHPETATTLNNLGQLYLATGDYVSARTLLEHAVAAFRKILGEEHPETATALNNLGSALLELGDLPGARHCYEQSLAVRRKILGEEHPDVAFSLNSMGYLLGLLGDRAAARPYYEQALAIRRKVLGDDHPASIASHSNLGWFFATIGEPGQAADQFVVAANSQLRLLEREAYGMSDAKIQLFLNEIVRGFDFLASLPLEKLDREADIATVLLSHKAVAFEVLNRRRAVTYLAVSRPEFSDLQTSLLQARQSLETLAVNPPHEATPDEVASRRRSLVNKCEDLESQLSQELAKLLGTDSSLSVSLNDVRGRLNPGSALVEFVRYDQMNFGAEGTERQRGDSHYAALTIKGNPQSPIAFVDLGPATEIDALISELAEQVRGYRREGRTAENEAAQEAEYREVAAKLYAKLIEPLEDALGGEKELFVGPDGRLHEIPFEALVDGNGRYLIEAGYQIAYVNSGRDLVRKRTDAAGDGVYVFAGPNYNETGPARLAAVERLSKESGLRKSNVPDAESGAVQLVAANSPISRSADARIGWRHLPGADLEGQEAGAAFSSAKWGEVSTYTGDDALEDLVKRVAKPRVLVFVTHGDFLEDQPAFLSGNAGGVRSFGELGFERSFGDSRGGAGQARAGLRATEDPMLRSYLLLAGANKIDEPLPEGVRLDNGWLTAQEIGQLDLRGTDLVVLSACNTGRGASQSGQAVAGMRSAFLFAGASTIVGSLYEVPNAETRQLMKPFYEGVAAGRGKLASLNAAKRRFLADRRRMRGAAHPFYWASFVLVGQP
jgi:tetratricopeptide (TPR) repeat protein/CHAT domain-containing protein